MGWAQPGLTGRAEQRTLRSELGRLMSSSVTGGVLALQFEEKPGSTGRFLRRDVGLFSRFLSGSAGDNEVGSSSGGTMLECDGCDRKVDEDDLQDGLCQECSDLADSSAKYCCGAIYEDGEDTCRSCGEPL